MILHIRVTAAEMCFKEETGMGFDLTSANSLLSHYIL